VRAAAALQDGAPPDELDRIARQSAAILNRRVTIIDAEGNVLASPGTSHHRRFVRTPETYYLHKQAGEPLVIELERRAGEVVIVDVQ